MNFEEPEGRSTTKSEFAHFSDTEPDYSDSDFDEFGYPNKKELAPIIISDSDSDTDDTDSDTMPPSGYTMTRLIKKNQYKIILSEEELI